VSRGRVAIYGEFDQYVSLSRAKWLVSAHRARFLPSGHLQILHGRAHAEPGTAPTEAGNGPPVRWTSYSGCQAQRKLAGPWSFGWRMNGGAINRGS
jgi:hypothetical protein